MSLGIGDLGVSYIRTAAPTIAAAGLTALGDTFDVQIPLVAEQHATAITFFVLWALWYGVFRWAEERWPKVGAFLGVPAAPVYDAAPTEYEVHETTDPATGTVTERRTITRYPSRTS